jgi:hypothetical protein
MKSRQLAGWLVLLSVPTLFPSAAAAQGFRLRAGDAAAFMAPVDDSKDRPLLPVKSEWVTLDPPPAGNGGPPPVELPPPAEVVPDAPDDNFFQQGHLRFRLSGQYRVLPNFSNFDFQPLTIGNNQPSENFANQRLRLGLSVFPNENVEGYLQLQIGGFLWGQNFEFPKTFPGPFSPLGADRVGIMLRRGWMAYSDEECGRFRIGILDWHDSFGDTLASSDYEFDVAGVDWTKTFHDLGDLKLWVGAFILDDQAFIQSDLTPGNHDAFLFTFDADQPFGDVYSAGFSFYYIADYGEYSYPTFTPYRSSWDLWVGLRAKADWKPVPVNGFVLFNPGQRDGEPGTPFFEHAGWAAKLEAGPICCGPGKFSAQLLYSTGDSDPGVGHSTEFRTVAQTYRDNFGSQGYWSYLYITSPNGPADVKDLGVSLQDRGFGLFTVQGKYEYPICHRFSGISAAGWLWSDKTNNVGQGKDIGPELAQQFTYDFGGGLKADFGAAVLFTGDFYRASPAAPKPNDLWMVFSRVQLEF